MRPRASSGPSSASTKPEFNIKMDLTIKFENVPEELAGQMPESMAIAENYGVVVTLIDQSEFDAALSSTTALP